jgi:PAS domain S-box-containing protein
MRGTYELDVITKGGRRLTLEISTQFLRSAQGITGFESIARDVTSRIRAAEQLRNSEAELAEAQRIGLVGSWEYSVPERVLRMSAQARRLLDLAPDPAPCRAGQVLSRVHPADRETVKAALRRVRRRVKDVAMDQRVRLRNGAERMTHSRLEARFDETGRCVHLHGTIQDITERHQAQELLRMLSQAVEQSPAIVMITDPEGHIDYVNQKFIELTGYSYAEVKGQNPRLLKSGETTPEVYRNLWLTIKAGRQWTGEFHNQKKDGALYWEEAVISPIKDRQGQIVRFLALKEDVTERKQAEKLKTQLELQLRQAQKMEALGTLAGGIAHDFNNILGAIVGYSELARIDAAAHPNILESLEQVAQASERAKDLVQQILAFSRQSKPERKPVRLRPIVKECLKLLRSTLPATIDIVSDFPAETPVVMADPIQIHQVIMNLCTNAAHAMQGKAGRLSVGLGWFTVDGDFARLHPQLRPGSYARLVVDDSGHGMTTETIKRIFDPFFTTKPPGEGTGLGLAVVHGIVEDHQGAILVASQPGVGSTFQIFFPTHQSKEQDAEIPRAPIPRGDGEHILFVDDEPALCRVAQKLLQSWGYRVTTHLNAPDALAGFGSAPEAYDLVITDLSMPGMNGVDLAAKLIKIRANVPVILTSGFMGTGTSELAAQAGIREVLLKPVAPALWRGVIDRVLHGTAVAEEDGDAEPRA